MLRSSLGKIAVYLAFFAAVPAFPAERQVLHGHVLPASAQGEAGTRLPGAQKLGLIISLPLRNRENLTNLLQQLSDPTSPRFRRYLTPEEFTAQFGPTPQDYQSVADFARSNGLRITGNHRNRTLIQVEGSVEQIEKTLHLRLQSFQHPKEARRFFAPDIEPSLDLKTPVLRISGLDNYTLPHPRNLKQGAANRALPRTGSGPDGNFLGNDFRAAYAPGVSLTGAGQMVGVVEFDGYYTSDISRYLTLAGQPNVALENVLVAGSVGTAGGANVEVALDIEMAIAMAPGLTKVLVYEAPNSEIISVANTVLNSAAMDNRARQISCSWGFTVDSATDQIFQQFIAQGVSFFLASGDSDAFGSLPDPPSDNPNITVVGGTTLTTSGPGGAWSSETTWNWGFVSGHGYVGSSGGISAIYPTPDWQKNVDMSLNQGSTTRRNLPDVALTADSIWVTYGNVSAGVFGGTSCAAPLWAGFTALVNEQAAALGVPPVGFLNPTIYSLGAQVRYPEVFHDITTGNNFNSISPDKFSAVPGYDLCTGWGTPNGSNLITALLPVLRIQPDDGFTASGLLDGAFNITSQTFFVTSVGPADVQWSLVNTSSWLNVSPVSGALSPGGSPTPITVSLSDAAATLSTGIYTANLLFTNQSDAFTQSRLFALRIGQPTIVQNGGFETGDFSGWQLSGADVSTYLAVVNQTAILGNLTDASSVSGSVFVHTGNYGTELGENGSVGFLGQQLPTFAGRHYLLSFWLEDPFGGTPSECTVKWNGATLFDWVNMPTFTWTNLQFLVTATGPTTDLEFGFRNDPNAFGLDDVSVTLVPSPAFLSATATNGILTLTWSASPGLTYQLQSKTNLNSASWTNVGLPLIATNTTLSFVDLASPDPQRFYRVVISP